MKHNYVQPYAELQLIFGPRGFTPQNLEWGVKCKFWKTLGVKYVKKAFCIYYKQIKLIVFVCLFIFFF
jgi:hypothetical protein